MSGSSPEAIRKDQIAQLLEFIDGTVEVLELLKLSSTAFGAFSSPDIDQIAATEYSESMAAVNKTLVQLGGLSIRLVTPDGRILPFTITAWHGPDPDQIESQCWTGPGIEDGQFASISTSAIASDLGIPYPD